jgi:uncharacterized surface protein with fasciclin (FAS1) repeats
MKQNTMIIVGVAIVAVVLVGGFLFMNMQNSSSQNNQTTEMTTTTTPVAESETMNDKNIVVVAKEAGTFTTLLAAAEAAGLVETLSGPGPLTVLAPTDEAFAKLPAGTVESLLQDKERLAKILTYHVIPGKVMSSDVAGMDSATTVEGGKVTIKTENGKVMINNATVTNPDIEASNGVIHVIDTVLIPE